MNKYFNIGINDSLCIMCIPLNESDYCVMSCSKNSKYSQICQLK